MLGDRIVVVLLILAMIAVIITFFKDFIPGILSAFVVIFKLVFNLVLLPLGAIRVVFLFLFRRRDKIIGSIVKTVIVSKRSIDRHGNFRTNTESVSRRIPYTKKDIEKLNKSDRF